MKKSKRYVKKMEKRSLINKKALSYVIAHSNICQHAIKELKLVGYGNGEGGPNDWMYQQVLEAVAVFSSHGNSGSSAPWEINLVQKLCNWDIISPLTFKDDEWNQISKDGTCQNKRKSSIFKEPDGNIHDIDAFTKSPKGTYRFSTKQWEKMIKIFVGVAVYLNIKIMFLLVVILVNVIYGVIIYYQKKDIFLNQQEKFLVLK